MAHFTLPTFNITAKIWRFGVATSDPPAVVTVANLAAGRRVLTLPGGMAGPGATLGSMLLLMPKVTDIQDAKNGIGPDTVEVPSGTGRFYQATWVDDVSIGFPTEHRFAQLTWGGVVWPTPFPGGSPSPPPPPPTDAVLLEDGSNVLLEDGSFLLLE